jgi:hypothetical protein
MRWISAFLFLLFAPLVMAETPLGAYSELEGGMVVKRPLPAQTAKPRIDGLTWTILAADGGARALDAYSTRRMLKNSCSSGLQMAGTSTCNYEQNLPGFIANHTSGMYAFDGVVWLSEVAATRLLVRHHHRRLARLIPFMDFLSTTSFAVNNLTLSIGEQGVLAAPAARTKSGGPR